MATGKNKKSNLPPTVKDFQFSEQGIKDMLKAIKEHK